jgi:hypothetical protein
MIQLDDAAALMLLGCASTLISFGGDDAAAPHTQTLSIYDDGDAGPRLP